MFAHWKWSSIWSGESLVNYQSHEICIFHTRCSLGLPLCSTDVIFCICKSHSYSTMPYRYRKQVIYFLFFGNSVSSTEVPSVTNHFNFNIKVFSSQANWQALGWGSTCTVIDQWINQWEHIYTQKKLLQLTKTVPTLYLLFAQVQQSYYNCTVHVHVAILQGHTQMRESNILPGMYPRVCGGREAVFGLVTVVKVSRIWSRPFF